MNITIFAGFYLPTVGGYIKNIHELARRLVLKSHSVTVITSNTGHDAAKECVDGVNIIRRPSWRCGGVFIPKSWPCKENLNSDVVITQTRFFPTTLMGVLYARKNKLPLIHVERGSYHSPGNNIISRLLGIVFDHTIGSWIIRTAKYVLAISGASRDFSIHLGSNPTKTAVVYNGITLPASTTTEKHTETRLVFVGRLVYAKGVQDLLCAFDRACTAGLNISLTIIGDGNYKRNLESQAQTCQYASKIKFLGELPNSEVFNQLAQCDLFINPSYSEGLPTTVLEAASLGLPIIATDVGGTGEIIENAVSGTLVKPQDIEALASQIIRIVKDMSEAKRLGKYALFLVRYRFDWENITDQWEYILKEVTAKRG